MDNQQSTDYTSKYQELQLLGRGNYGSAYVVRAIQSGKYYVAKKMNLDGMTQAEIEGAKQQISILKKFSDSTQYLFIVKYIESFYFQRTLIIVMEFCQYGDLATFLKHAKKKGQLLDEKVILAWFIMLIFGIQALHSKNVLHRDLKAANVFLTSNKYVKIGDFGISKVLDSTSAKTFVGTPYYLSPEVCSNKKYDLRSDLWSLGCILYQLCTLNYPFQANNILSLAMKITTQQVSPISNKYSKQLNEIVSGLLTKDQNKRISLKAILQMPYIKKFMLEQSQNIDQICQKIPLKKSTKFETTKNGEGTIKKQDQTSTTHESSNQETMKTIKSNFQKTSNSGTLTLDNKSMKTDTLGYSQTGMLPKDLAKMRKEQKIRQQQQILKQSQKQYSDARNFAKLKKQQQFGGSGSNFGKSPQMDLKKSMERQCLERNKQAAQEKIRVNKGLDANQPINLQQLNTIREQTLKMTGFNLTKNNSTLPIDLTASVQKKIIGMNQNYKMYTQTVQEDISDDNDQQLQQYYDEDFQTYDNSQEQKAEIQNQHDTFKSYLKVFSGQKSDVSPSKLASVEKAFEIKPIGIRNSPSERKQQCIKKCINLVNKDRFKLLYELVSQGYVGLNYKESEQLKQIRKKGSPSQKQALRLIDLIKYLQMEQKGMK